MTMNPHFLTTIILIILVAIEQTNGAKILVVAPFFGSSHAKIVQTVALNLAKRGHEITLITSNVVEDPPPKFNQIVVDVPEAIKNVPIDFIWQLRNLSMVGRLYFTWYQTFQSHQGLLGSKPLMDFIENDKSHFDAVIVEMFYDDIMYLFAHKYKAPLILLETSIFKRQVEDIMGNPFPVSYVPYELHYASSDMSFIDRLHNLILHAADFYGRKFYYTPKSNEFAKNYFKSLPEPLPNIEDMERNVSLILANTHYSIDTVLPLVPGMVQIGGIHIKPPKPLPQEIKKFMDAAKDGVIVFTMGTHTQISVMDQFKIKALLKVFSSLKQRVIMKWENDSLPTTSNNILMLKFLPQNDILAHPKVRAFITHGGMLGLQEAISYGVPIIGIPLFADQYVNVARLVHLGAAVELDLLLINEDTVRHSIDQILNVPSYREMALELSKRFNERPMGPVETAMYWIEYVIKFKGTPFLKSPLVDIPWYKYRLLDVVAFFIMLPLLFIIGCCCLMKMFCKKGARCHQTSRKTERKKRD